MAISPLTGLFMCHELASDPRVPRDKIVTRCKQSAFGRAVYRITYPVRQLISSLVLIPPRWTVGAARNTWTALENRQCNPDTVKLILSVTSNKGVCALAASLTLGITFTVSTVGLAFSVGKAICEPGIDAITSFVRFIPWTPYLGVLSI